MTTSNVLAPNEFMEAYNAYSQGILGAEIETVLRDSAAHYRDNVDAFFNADEPILLASAMERVLGVQAGTYVSQLQEFFGEQKEQATPIQAARVTTAPATTSAVRPVTAGTAPAQNEGITCARVLNGVWTLGQRAYQVARPAIQQYVNFVRQNPDRGLMYTGVVLGSMLTGYNWFGIAGGAAGGLISAGVMHNVEQQQPHAHIQ